jgi:2-polyprenyl-6-methoxyphenol hydroxylase-like FAD-dependent oxidoreductase
MTNKVPFVVIVGGGFGGLAAAKALRRDPVVVLIDRSNHHVFQPSYTRQRHQFWLPVRLPLRSAVSWPTKRMLL